MEIFKVWSITDCNYLWAKKSKTDFLYLPVLMHLLDTEAAILILYNNTISENLKTMLEEETSGSTVSVLRFIALCHDLGKISPSFQRKKSNNKALDEFLASASGDLDIFYGSDGGKCPHNLISQQIVEKMGVNTSVSCILGGHHGTFGSSCELKSYSDACGFNPPWCDVQKAFFDYAVQCSGFDIINVLSKKAQVLLTGLLITADWLSSNEEIFPLLPADEQVIFDETFLNRRNEFAENKITDIFKLPNVEWQSGIRERIYNERFGFSANEFQKAVTESAASILSPGIMIIEAPMGCGKTEAALAAAEIFAENTGASGIYFALPTQATSDGIFSRILEWVKRLGGMHNIVLAHGKAIFNMEFMSLPTSDSFDGEDNGAFAESWFNGRKKSLLANFGVGTIDTILKAAQRSKHVVLAHLGLAQKIVIIDECHAYDAYMSEYLNRLLYFLGVYKVPVIILSATLPYKKRSELISAYTRQKAALQNLNYPLITYSDGDNVIEHTDIKMCGKKEIAVLKSDNFDLSAFLTDKLSGGGSAAIIMNTVKCAQKTAEILREKFGDDVMLIHSRFLPEDRAKKEAYLKSMIGKSGKFKPTDRFIVVGTQVIEQSLDIDFDLMITQIAPMDLFLQRIGRLHRHNRLRPEKLLKPMCVVLESEDDFKSSEIIYGEYLLLKTQSLLSDYITLPDDISVLVNKVYSEEAEEFSESYNGFQDKIVEKQRKAKAFLLQEIKESKYNPDLKDFSYNSQTDTEAGVRDGNSGLEVIMVKASELTGIPDNDRAKNIAKKLMRLPIGLSTPKILSELERRSIQHSQWLKSPWLCGMVFMTLDENNETEIEGYRIKYSKEEGLIYERI
jgi:CRISPR-associated endonuclease/helicase Cas3